MPKQYQFHVPDISCSGCVTTINSLLNPIPSITKIDVNIFNKLVTVTVNDDSACDETTIQDILLPIFPNVRLNEEDEEKKRQIARKIIRGHIYKGLLGCGVGATLLALSLFGIGIPMFAMCLIGGICTALTLFIGKESYKKAWASLRNKEANMEVLFSISTIVSLVVSILSCCPIPGLALPMLFDTPLLIFGFHHIGTAIKQASEREISSNLNHCSLAPREVHIIDETSKNIGLLVKVNDLRMDDCILVKQGDRIPVDGIYIDDDSLEVDDSLRNGGGAFAQILQKNHAVFAGMKANKDCHIKVTATVANSWLAQRDKECEKNKTEKPAIEHTAEKILKIFVPGIVLFATALGVGVGILFNPALAVLLIIAILVSACPCILGLVVPLAIKVAIGKGIKQGIEFVNHKSVQDVADAKIDVVVFDVNGTITQGKPVVEKFKPLIKDFDVNGKELFQALYAIEKNSSHLIAKAICSHLKKTNINFDENLQLTTKSCGEGISAEWKGHLYSVGNSLQMNSLIKMSGFIKSNKLRSRIDSLENQGRQVILIARDHKILGYFIINDPLCPDAFRTVKQLQTQKIRTMFITGTTPKTANAIGRKLGISEDDIIANCIEGEGSKKSVHVKNLKEQGLGVAVVGDYINDIGAFDFADISFFKQHPCSDEDRKKIPKEKEPREIAKSHAQVIVSNLSGVLDAFTISKRTLSQIKQCLALSLSYNLLTIFALSAGILAGFIFPPGVAAAIMILQVVGILFKVYCFKCKEITSTAEFAEQPPDNLMDSLDFNLEDDYELENSLTLNSEISSSNTSNENEGSEFKFKLTRSRSCESFIPIMWPSSQKEVNHHSYVCGL